MSEVVEGALAAVTPVPFTPGSIVVIPPRIDVLALAPGTLEGAIFPPQRMDVDLAGFYTEQLETVARVPGCP